MERRPHSRTNALFSGAPHERLQNSRD